MNQLKIYIAEGIRPTIFTKWTPDIEEEILGNQFDIHLLDKGTEEEILPIVGDADAMIVRPGIQITSKSLDTLKQCKIIANMAIGFDNIDIEYAAKKNILVCNVPDYGTEEVADSTFALFLSLAKKISLYNSKIRDENIWDWREGKPQHRMRGRTLGIIGLGRIGTAMAMRAKPFGLDIVYYDPYKPDGTDKALGITKCDHLEELVSTSDYITIHTPLTDETLGMLNMDFFSRAKKDLILINTARGKLFDSFETIYTVLKDGMVSGLGLDVLPTEPPDYNEKIIKAWQDDEPWIKNRLLLLPHASFYSEGAIRDIRLKAALAIKKFFAGDKTKNVINKDFLPEKIRKNLL
jgi:lactate dehydrogenase-like 2-hydroxyacid dehydrogenase